MRLFAVGTYSVETAHAFRLFIEPWFAISLRNIVLVVMQRVFCVGPHTACLLSAQTCFRCSNSGRG